MNRGANRFMTRSDVEKEISSIGSVCLDLKLAYPFEVDANPYLAGYAIYQFQKVNDQRGNTREHVVHFLDFMGAFAMILTFA